MSLSFNEIAAFKIGDVFYECGFGMNVEARVMLEPVLDTMEGEPRRQLRWSAKSTQTGDVINYLITEGLEHYGPRIYREPAYLFRHPQEPQP